jgi:hypothetical protein
MRLRYQILISAVLTIVVIGYELDKKLRLSMDVKPVSGARPASTPNTRTMRINSASAYFSNNRGTPSIGVSGDYIQLWGDLYDGLIVAPSFIVYDSIVSAPDSVKFLFISYSTERREPELRSFAIYDGQKRLFRGEPKVNVSSPAMIESGTASETYEIQVPYSVFSRMCEATSVSLDLGVGKRQLLETELQKLRDVKAFVDQGVAFSAD